MITGEDKRNQGEGSSSLQEHINYSWYLPVSKTLISDHAMKKYRQSWYFYTRAKETKITTTIRLCTIYTRTYMVLKIKYITHISLANVVYWFTFQGLRLKFSYSTSIHLFPIPVYSLSVYFSSEYVPMYALVRVPGHFDDYRTARAGNSLIVPLQLAGTNSRHIL